jgi:C4-dicarboxylate-specific signal transduction histidine kinase
MHEDQYNGSHWALDKRINISHIAATLMMVVGLVLWGAEMQERVAVVEAAQREMQQRITSEAQQTDRDIDRIEASIDRNFSMLLRIDDKLDQKKDIEENNP